MIDKLTIAVVRMEAMAGFYARVLGAELTASGPFRIGRMQGMSLVLCPREIAGVKAEANTIQLRFVVKDVAEAVRLAKGAGGTVIDEPAARGGAMSGSVRDPDGNSLEFVQG